MDVIRQKRERDFWDFFARRYDSFMKNSSGLYGEILALIRQELQPDFMILDLAAGTGLLTLELAPHVKKVYGIDISPKMISLAEAKARLRNIGNVEFCVGDAYQIPFAAGAFDAVVIGNALHVMLQPERVLAEAHRVLKKDGLLLVPTFCHGENYLSRISSFVMGLVGFKAFQRWSAESFTRFIENNRYQVIHCEVRKGIIPLTYLAAGKV
ncbi:MAG TPA: class I SAM-dependent methyltransferase [Firmicutes bacterium]|jgi:phosphatidylethanolamine/phosphatidyl-N-methylethanolamine N-methyltransferase|nr:class I SAM-dependent methyltransferase [Bacillota bacterium]